MMKRIFIILFACACGASFSFAQSLENGAEESMIDVSLKSLKGSYQKLADQNRLLASEIEGYRNHIQSLQQELDFSESHKAKLSAVLHDQEKTGDAFPEAAYRQEIEQLRSQIDATSEKAVERAFQQKKGELDTALERSRGSLRAAHAQVNKLKEESAGVVTSIARLKVRQAQLQQQLADRQAGRDVGSVKAYAHQLDKEITNLRLRQRALDKKLSHAPKEDPGDINKFTEESYNLRRRFVSLSDENMRLKRELFSLGTIAVSPQP